ncbi:MAG: tripartite tricarboxylate transporter substrate-binding protein [Achromobacter sp.]|uniref:tripartite tricarboxylate transporter substrate-binding protein n=1 Tax=Achromobacter sp. TaxID=134375 RepID=UPI003CFEDA08
MIKKIFAAGLMVLPGLASAQAFPSRPVTLVVPFSAGGPTDVVARQLAAAMGRDLGQTVIVDNRPSSGGIVGSEAVLRSAPDGYTLLIHNIGMSTLKSLSPEIKFDPQRDFSYIGEVVDVPMTLVARKDLPPDGFAGLVEYLRANQKKINLSNAGIGTASHLCGLLLMSRLNLALTTIPYKGAAPAMTDLQGGQVDLLCDQITTTLQPILGGRVRAYGSTTSSRLRALPALPTLAEQGLENFEVTVWHGVYAPKGVPGPVVERLDRALQAALADPAFVESMRNMGATPVSAERATPKGLRTKLDEQVSIWTPLIQQSQALLR